MWVRYGWGMGGGVGWRRCARHIRHARFAVTVLTPRVPHTVLVRIQVLSSGQCGAEVACIPKACGREAHTGKHTTGESIHGKIDSVMCISLVDGGGQRGVRVGVGVRDGRQRMGDCVGRWVVRAAAH